MTPQYTTTFNDWHIQNGATMVDWAGWSLPLHYGSIVEEHRRTRKSVTLFDVSHMGRIFFQGRDINDLLQRFTTRNIADMKIGEVRYTLFTNKAGGILDDGLIYHLDDPDDASYYLVVVNGCNRHKMVDWFRHHLSQEKAISIEDRTLTSAMVAIQGPMAYQAIKNCSSIDPIALKPCRGMICKILLQELIESTIPSTLPRKEELRLPDGIPEEEALASLQKIADENLLLTSHIGMGYYGTHLPNAICRNVWENPGWYIPYTPYQGEISQGLLETLFDFQRMILDFTAMEVANASLLDEGTAAAETMTLCKRASLKKSSRFFISDDVHSQTIDVVTTRAKYFGLEIIQAPLAEILQHDVFAALVQYPGSSGAIVDLSSIIEKLHQTQKFAIIATYLLALALIKPPGEMSADVVIGTAQRFGIPLGFGGPHPAFFATRNLHKRLIPGRIIGLAKDSRGKLTFRMALQTREQHIRREKATANICTSEELLANIAALYAIYHGPKGIRLIAERTHRLTVLLATGLKKLLFQPLFDHFFDTITIRSEESSLIALRAEREGCNLRLEKGTIGISLDETSNRNDLLRLWRIFAGKNGVDFTFESIEKEAPLTMNLTATTSMIPLSWPSLSQIHPFVPSHQRRDYTIMIQEIATWLM